MKSKEYEELKKVLKRDFKEFLDETMKEFIYKIVYNKDLDEIEIIKNKIQYFERSRNAIENTSICIDNMKIYGKLYKILRKLKNAKKTNKILQYTEKIDAIFDYIDYLDTYKG